MRQIIILVLSFLLFIIYLKLKKYEYLTSIQPQTNQNRVRQQQTRARQQQTRARQQQTRARPQTNQNRVRQQQTRARPQTNQNSSIQQQNQNSSIQQQINQTEQVSSQFIDYANSDATTLQFSSLPSYEVTPVFNDMSSVMQSNLS